MIFGTVENPSRQALTVTLPLTRLSFLKCVLGMRAFKSKSRGSKAEERIAERVSSYKLAGRHD